MVTVGAPSARDGNSLPDPGAPMTPGVPMTMLDAGALDPVTQRQCSLAVQLRRVTGAVVGRPIELAAIRNELDEARSRLSAVTLEGEPGIGKTRLLVAAAELAATLGFVPVAVTADEEIRGPFLLAQSIFAAAELREVVAGTPAETAVRRAVDAISGRDEPGLEALSPEGKLLRAFDQAALALAAVATQRPLALLVDDLQWADDDTLRMLRYAVRGDATSPIFLLLAIRPDEFAEVTEAVNFVADMERMGLVRRLRIGRLSQLETAEFLRQVLAGPLDPASAATMHAQSEGVPFIVEELARTYREAGMVQQVDGTWTLAKNAARLVPSAVRTLIQRRAARLPPATRAAMGDAALLGRSFSLRDLQAIRLRLRDQQTDPTELADALGPAVTAGLLLEHHEGSPADYTFTHEQVREFASAALSQARRRSIHAAIVELLAGDGDPPPASLAMLASHALAAGDGQRAARFSIEAARVALQSNAPEEALRVIEQALPIVSSAQDRRDLLTARDDAYAMVRKPGNRLEGLAELAALAEAMRDSHFELEVMIRRACALRLAGEQDLAADLARRVRTRAADRGDRAAELAACFELGQDLMRSSLGETLSAIAGDVDLDGAEEAYRAAAALATELGDDRSIADANRELGAVLAARLRAWFIEQLVAGRGPEFARRTAAGETIDQMLASFPIAPLFTETLGLFQKALEIYERLGDRRGVMSTVIAMAYINYGPVIHLASSARHIEEIRRVTARLSTMVTESERARADLQALYGVHVYARAKVVPDLTLVRGEEAYRAARILGDRTIEFLAAGGMVLAHLELGELDKADGWLDRAATAMAEAPTPLRNRQLETWRGMARAAAGDAAGMRLHMERALKIATDQGRPAARCETLARYALESARLGATTGDEDLLRRAEQAALEAKDLMRLLPGHAPWGAQADAALGEVALARGDPGLAATAAGAAMEALQAAHHEDMNLDVLLPVARAVLAGGPPDMQAGVRGWLQIQLANIAQRTLNESLRVRWLRGPVGRELTRLAGPLDGVKMEREGEALTGGLGELTERDASLLRLLAAGNTNREIAESLGTDEATVARELGEIYVRIGVSSRAEATSFAFHGNRA